MSKSYKLFEGENREASDFVSENYHRMVEAAHKMGVRSDLANDVVHDVYISLLRSEQSGNAYDSEYCENGDYISVEEFVFGRLKGYCKNGRYHTEVSGVEVPAGMRSSQDTEIDSMDNFQKAYALASVYDDIDAAETTIDIRSNIQVCATIGKALGWSVIDLFRQLGDPEEAQYIDKELFSSLKMAVENTEMAEAIIEVGTYAQDNYEQFLALVDELQVA